MTWICQNCGTNNDDSQTKCRVCDYERQNLVADTVDKPYIFVSYAHVDANKVYPIIDALQKQFYVWFDTALEYGKYWEDNIFSKIKNSTIFLFVVTKASLDNECFCRNEIDFARRKFKGNHHKQFINLIVDDDFEFPDWFEGGYMLYQACYLSRFKTIQQAIEDLGNKCKLFENVRKAEIPVNTEEDDELSQYFWDTFLGSSNAFENTIQPSTSSSVLPEQTSKAYTVPAVPKKKSLVNLNPAATNGKLTIDIAKSLPVEEDGTLIIPEGYTSIGGFAGRSDIKSVIMPSTLVKIGLNTFKDCKNLTSAVIPNSVTRIGDQAFAGCSGLTFVIIGNSVTNIGQYAFSGCTRLTSIIIPNSVTVIGWGAFYHCSGLTSITISDSVKVIEYGAFDGCREITSITIPQGVKSIESNTFLQCNNLTSIVIPDSVKSIEDSAFYNCCKLKSITIPGGVKSIGKLAFAFCTGLTSITFNGTKTQWEAISKGFNWNEKIGAYTLNCMDDSQPTSAKTAQKSASKPVAQTVTKSPDKPATSPVTKSADKPVQPTTKGELTQKIAKTLHPDKDGKFVISNDYESIGNSAFNSRKDFTSITIPNSVTSIGIFAFGACSCLTSITIPNSVTRILDNAFNGCTGLTAITIPDNVTSIGEGAFLGCSSLTSIAIPDSVTSIGDHAFHGCSGLTSVIMPNSVSSLGDWTFQNCSSLTSITIPNSVKSIGKIVFSGCTHLKSVTIGNNLKRIGQSAFARCNGLSSIMFDGTKAQWKAIAKGERWDGSTGKYVIHCSDGDIAKK